MSHTRFLNVWTRGVVEETVAADQFGELKRLRRARSVRVCGVMHALSERLDRVMRTRTTDLDGFMREVVDETVAADQLDGYAVEAIQRRKKREPAPRLACD